MSLAVGERPDKHKVDGYNDLVSTPDGVTSFGVAVEHARLCDFGIRAC